MFNMGNMNTWLNKIEQKGNATRLDPVSAEFATKYMEGYIEQQGDKISVEQFKKDFMGTDAQIPETLKSEICRR